MGRHLSFCVDVFGRENKAESSSSQKQKSKRKWKFGRSHSHQSPNPSPPVERNSPSPVQTQPLPPVEKSPSQVSFQSSPPVEKNSQSPVPSPPHLSPIRVIPFHATEAAETFITPTRPPTGNVEQTNKPFPEPVHPLVSTEPEPEPEATATVTQFTEPDLPQEILLEFPEEVNVDEMPPTADVASSSSQSKEEIAATKIQAAYRGYLARRALKALKSLVRLKALVDGDSTKRQTAIALKSMQSLTRIQSQVRSRRIRMQEENQALRKQLQLKHERDLERFKLSGDWNHSIQSKEQIEANLLHKQDAALRRERSLAYAYSHQWKASSRTVTTTFLLDPTNPQWGWGWLDRWMVPRISDSSFTPTERDSTNSTNPLITKSARKSLQTKFSNPNLSPERPSSPASSVMSRSSIASQKNSSAGRRNSYMQTTESARARLRLLQTGTKDEKVPEIIDEKEKKGPVKKRSSFSVPDSKSNVPGTHHSRARRQTGPHRPSDVASIKSVASIA